MTDLKQMAELRAKATQGTWVAEHNGHYWEFGDETGRQLGDVCASCLKDHPIKTGSGETNAAFIAAAGNFDFAKAAAEKAALEERVKRLEEALLSQQPYVDCAVNLALSTTTIYNLDGTLSADTNAEHFQTALKMAAELMDAHDEAQIKQVMDDIEQEEAEDAARTALENSND